MKYLLSIIILLNLMPTAFSNDIAINVIKNTKKIHKSEILCEGTLTAKGWYDNKLLGDPKKKEFFDQFTTEVRELNSGVFVMLDFKLVGTNAQYDRPSTYANIEVYPNALKSVDLSNDSVTVFKSKPYEDDEAVWKKQEMKLFPSSEKYILDFEVLDKETGINVTVEGLGTCKKI